MGKSTNVYGSLGEGISDILESAIADEPDPTPRAPDLVKEALAHGQLNPVFDPSDSLPALSDGGGGSADDPGALATCSPRESAENAIELLFTLVPAGDWQPENDAERAELTRALERVFTLRGWSLTLPPEAILVAVMGKYTRRRMAKPAVRARAGPWLAKLPILGKLLGGAPDPAEAAAALAAKEARDSLPRMSPPSDLR